MLRTLAVTLLLMALAGFAVGWMSYSSFKTVAPPPTSTSNPASGVKAPVVRQADGGAEGSTVTGVVDVVQRFALRPADISADRETPAVAVAPDGTVVLAWASQAETGGLVRTLYLARSTDGGVTFDKPLAWREVPILKFTSEGGSSTGRKMVFSTQVLPRLEATRDGVAVGWVEAVDGGPTVTYLVARSSDGGRTFSPPIAAHGGDARRPGFTTMTADSQGSLACGWIDGRNQIQQPFFSLWPAGSEGFAPERLVFAGPEPGQGICPCCDVAVALTGTPGQGEGSERAAFVAFRNSDSGHRDIWLSRVGLEGESPFTAPAPVSRESWTFNGCPHDAPSLAIAGGQIHVAWMDAHTGVGRVYHAASPVADLSFHPHALAPDGPGAQGHPRIAAGADGRVHAVWDEGLSPAVPEAARNEGAAGHQGHQHADPRAGGGGRAIMYAVSSDGGETFSPGRALSPSPEVYQLQPSIALGPDGAVFIAWNELDLDGKHTVLVRLARPKQEPSSR